MNIKLYCDSAFYEETHKASVGIVVKRNKKRIYENNLIIDGVNDSTEAEFHAIYRGITILQSLGLTSAVVNSDSESNINMIKGKCKIKRKYKEMVNLINQFNDINSFTYTWIPRNKNQIAHELAYIK